MRHGTYRQAVVAVATMTLAALLSPNWAESSNLSVAARPDAREASWWSFQKLRRPQVPRLKQGSQPSNPIDAFVLAKLRKKRLKPGPAATRSVLLRRATFDLWGLPPTPAQAERFLRDESADAYERLIEELLESPRYGERWGHHWLNVVGYADSRSDTDDYHPNAWRYRDYVIKSFNEDKPYDRFVQEQIAGDELFPNNLELEGFYDLSPEKLEHLEAWIGTTIFALGTGGREVELNAEVARYRWLTEVVDKTTSSFLGLTLECARCHDHRSDPFSQEDYFRLQAIFAASRPSSVPVVASTTMGHRDEAYHLSIALAEARDAYLRFAGQVRDRVVETRKKDYSSEVVQAYETPAKERSARETELATPLVQLHRELNIEEHLSPEEAERHRELTGKLAKAAVLIPAKGLAHLVDYDGFYDVPSATVLAGVKTELIPETHLLSRGELAGKQHLVHPGLPRVLRSDSVSARLSRGLNGLQYRKQLALWLTEPTHPLTARVMVNRIWQGHFGQGLVRTAGDFGHQGDSPVHRELLDWLACRFVDQGWSVKSMHRLIMLSNAYRRASRFTTGRHQRRDPSNRYWWRMNPRRLERTAVWDAIHQVSGTLNLKTGGRPAIPPLAEVEGATSRMKTRWPASDDPAEGRRRAVYLLTRRAASRFHHTTADPASNGCPVKKAGNEGLQSFWKLNREGLYRQARNLASRLVREAGKDASRQIDLAWQLTLARMPTEREKRKAMGLLEPAVSRNGPATETSPPQKDLESLELPIAGALIRFCGNLFNKDEFLRID
ncbi:MAG: DUF1549 and DUF1553 domain-containing protein [Acidobacteriota bacterium]|nr:DUF1549 and DUF1553 domain-containing protein [Acidobacteriota bacterium]